MCRSGLSLWICIRELYHSDSCNGLLFVNASNAFNVLNRNLALRNVLHLYPSLGRVSNNTYRADSPLFIDEEVIQSREGTTQIDPLAMAMYAIATIPLIQKLSESSNSTQLWYADDATAGGWSHSPIHSFPSADQIFLLPWLVEPTCILFTLF